HGEVLHDAGQVAEPDVHELDAFVTEVLENLVGVLECHYSSSTRCSRPRGSAGRTRERDGHRAGGFGCVVWNVGDCAQAPTRLACCPPGPRQSVPEGAAPAAALRYGRSRRPDFAIRLWPGTIGRGDFPSVSLLF